MVTSLAVGEHKVCQKPISHQYAADSCGAAHRGQILSIPSEMLVFKLGPRHATEEQRSIMSRFTAFFLCCVLLAGAS